MEPLNPRFLDFAAQLRTLIQATVLYGEDKAKGTVQDFTEKMLMGAVMQLLTFVLAREPTQQEWDAVWEPLI